MYFDTSVIMSLYVEDVFTEKAEAFYTQHASQATVSVWVDLEFKSALAFLVRTERLALEGAHLALETYREDRSRSVYNRVELTSEHFVAGATALRLEGALRAGDALHLGVAQVAGLPLVTSDRTLYRVAQENAVAATYLPEYLV